MAIKGLKELIAKIRENAGMTEEQVEEELNKQLPEHWVPKSTFNETLEAKKAAEKQAADNQKLLTDLNQKAGLSDEYKAQIDKLTADNAQAKKDYESKVAGMKLDAAIEMGLTKAKAHNSGQVAKLIDRDKIKLNADGSITGLDELISSMQKESAYLFESSDPKGGTGKDDPSKGPKPTFGGGGSGGDPSAGADEAMRAMFGL